MSHIQIRWLIGRDMDEVLAIEALSSDSPWTKSDLVKALRKRNAIGTVVELDFMIVGYMVYELYPQSIKVLKFAVDPEYRRQGIGRQMSNRLKEKLSQQRRKEVEIYVDERNVDAQLFLAKCGFKCEEIDGDYYTFRFWVRNRVMAQQTTKPESTQ